MPDLDTVLVAMGGGGLVSGVATVIKARAPHVSGGREGQRGVRHRWHGGVGGLWPNKLSRKTHTARGLPDARFARLVGNRRATAELFQ